MKLLLGSKEKHMHFGEDEERKNILFKNDAKERKVWNRLTDLILKDSKAKFQKFVQSIDNRLLKEIKKDAKKRVQVKEKRRGGVRSIRLCHFSILEFRKANLLRFHLLKRQQVNPPFLSQGM